MARVLSAELILISKFDASLIVRLAKPRASLLYIFRFWGFFFFFFPWLLFDPVEFCIYVYATK
ncbi:hypothetical protein I7I50_07694 [Histoplasma capsulatum G186AR]|nr:hypothetical protein I7I50_07694 [Histoplasma capsulatum G186AR]